MNELKISFTAKGQKRKVKSHIESERTRIQKTISKARETIREVDPETASLLRIETGSDLVYRPDQDNPPVWDLS